MSKVRIVPGIHSVEEALKIRPKAIQEIWFREGDLHQELKHLFDIAQKNHLKIKRSSIQGMDKIVYSHQGVIAHINDGPEWPTINELKSSESCMIWAFDNLEDPQNMGSLMRSAWGLGVSGVFITQDRSAGYAPSAAKVACGGYEHVPVHEISNLHAELKSLKDLGFWIYGLDEEAKDPACDVKFSQKTVFVIGAEHSGLRKTTQSACDQFVRIPQIETFNSFNASVSGGMMGYEYVRQWGIPKLLKLSTKKL